MNFRALQRWGGNHWRDFRMSSSWSMPQVSTTLAKRLKVRFKKAVSDLIHELSLQLNSWKWTSTESSFWGWFSDLFRGVQFRQGREVFDFTKSIGVGAARHSPNPFLLDSRPCECLCFWNVLLLGSRRQEQDDWTRTLERSSRGTNNLEKEY